MATLLPDGWEKNVLSSGKENIVGPSHNYLGFPNDCSTDFKFVEIIGGRKCVWCWSRSCGWANNCVRDWENRNLNKLISFEKLSNWKICWEALETTFHSPCIKCSFMNCFHSKFWWLIIESKQWNKYIIVKINNFEF